MKKETEAKTEAVINTEIAAMIAKHTEADTKRLKASAILRAFQLTSASNG